MKEQLELLYALQRDSIARAEAGERRFQRLRRSMVQSMNHFLEQLEDDAFSENGGEPQP